MPASAKRRTCTLTEAAYRLRHYNTGHPLGERQAESLPADRAGRARLASVATGGLNGNGSTTERPNARRFSLQVDP